MFYIEKLRFELLLLLFMVCIICSGETIGFDFTNCKKVERNTLLKLKHNFDDPFNNLGSWVGKDCCNWKRVGCDNLTGNVINLDLRSSKGLKAGEVNSALLELKYLRYLDLSNIYFNNSRIPQFLGSMTQLQHLNLSDSSFSGEVPQNLGNLTKLVSLDLSFCDSCILTNLEWASKLENLQYLGLSGTNLSQASDSLKVLLHKLLPSLLVLKLKGCGLEDSIHVMRNWTSPTPLQHLDLSDNSLSGSFPSFIQNLSSIRFLDLSTNQLRSPVPLWLGSHKHLKELYLDNNLFTGSFPSFIQNLSSIESIDLSSNGFNSSLPSWMASKNLKYLVLDQNSFTGPFPQFLQNSSSLEFIDLSSNQFTFSIPSWLAYKRELEYVDLSNNHFDRVDGGITNILARLCSLKTLDLSNNSIQEEVLESHANISRCSKYDLESLILSNNNISGHLPIIPSFSSLQYLLLSHNNLETVPPFLGSFSSLSQLDLSYNHLSVVHQVSLANLSSLIGLDISSNSFLLDVSPDWRPPFQLVYLEILPCKLNGPFPKWLLGQEQIIDLDLSDTRIFGPLPDNISNEMPLLMSLRLSNNRINGSIPKSLCDLNLHVLDLRKNLLSETIPDCWDSSQALDAFLLSSNTLSGPIPNSLTKLSRLQWLNFNNNSLEGELPEFTSKCERLSVLDVGRNNLHGEIPPWIGANFPSLQILILRENRLKGKIPLQLCSVHTLQIIDLAKTNLVGTIPQCFGNFEGMGSVQNPNDSTTLPLDPYYPYVGLEVPISPEDWSAMEVIKGEEREYTSVLHLLVNIDLSCNNLVGIIPTNLTSLSLLIGLNLSHNHLTGAIPKEIGKMVKLESLDLSSNNLSGTIPESVSSLTFLSRMNLSFNNLHGQIPIGHQLQVLDDPSIYWGNSGLCGDPLPNKCLGKDIYQTPTSLVTFKDGEEDKHDKIWFDMVIVLGFASGFWGVIGILVVKRRWRHVYFGLAEEIGDWLYVRVALWIARSKRGKVNVAQASHE